MLIRFFWCRLKMFKLNCDVRFDSFTLIVPSVSVGNVGQFAADLLITTLKMKKVGTVWDPAIVPVIGGDPYNINSEALMMSCELYADLNSKVAVLQLRSPLVASDAPGFLAKVTEYFRKDVKSVIILSSSFAAENHNVNVVKFRYFSNDLLNVDELKSMEWIDYNSEREGNIIVHGGGFAKKLFDACTEAATPCLVLFKYCSEGDNIPDALEMVTYLNKWLKLLQETEGRVNFTYPPSWNLLFGSPPPRELY